MAQHTDSCTLRSFLNAPNRSWLYSACTQYTPSCRVLVLLGRAHVWVRLAALQRHLRHRLGKSSLRPRFGGLLHVQHLTHLRKYRLDRRLQRGPPRQATTSLRRSHRSGPRSGHYSFLLDLLALFLQAASPLVFAFLTICRERCTRFLFESHSCGESVACTAVGGMLALTCAMAHHGRIFWYCESGVR